MEIERYMKLYKENSPEEFFNWMSLGRTIEVRFLSDRKGNKFKEYELIKYLANEIGADYRFTSLYIDTFDQLKKILLNKVMKYPLTRLYNIFIGVNPRRKVFTKSKNGLLKKTFYGGIAGTSHIQNILCDIEHQGKREGNATEAMLEECIQGARYLIKLHDIQDYYINISGNGVHLWFRLQDPIEIPIPKFTEYEDKVKYNLKEGEIRRLIKTYNKFIEDMDKDLKEFNERLKVDDGAKDIARIARAPGSWNVKQGKVARAVGTVEKNIKNIKYNNLKFTSVLPKQTEEYKTIKKTAKNTSKHRYNELTIHQSPLANLLCSGLLPSILSRNHYLEQSFARLLRDNDIPLSKVGDLILKMDATQVKTVQVDPDYLDDEEPFNSEVVNAYCYGCKIDLIYDIMEDVPEITEGYINEKHYEILNGISWKSMDKLTDSIIIDDKINSLFELKTLIRNLIDKYDRSTVFFALKLKLWDEWDYYDRNKIIVQIMNKTRQRVE